MGSAVLAIDGPAASGKSSTARAVAARLGLPHVESGALYRALTLAAVDAGIEFSGQRLVALARALPVRLDLTDHGFRPEVAGADVTRAIRDPRVTARVSELAAIPAVRDWVNAELRAAVVGHPRGAVLDGRDIGTVVFPDARVKVFLTADAPERARRRLLQDGAAPDEARVAAVADELRRRDAADAARFVAPLRAAEDAVVVDTTHLGLDEQVERIVALARNAFS